MELPKHYYYTKRKFKLFVHYYSNEIGKLIFYDMFFDKGDVVTFKVIADKISISVTVTNITKNEKAYYTTWPGIKHKFDNHDYFFKEILYKTINNK